MVNLERMASLATPVRMEHPARLERMGQTVRKGHADPMETGGHLVQLALKVNRGRMVGRDRQAIKDLKARRETLA